MREEGRRQSAAAPLLLLQWMTLRRLKTSEWFADVPVEGTAFLTEQTAKIHVADATTPLVPPHPSVLMRGEVLQQVDEWTVISCNGLMVGLRRPEEAGWRQHGVNVLLH